MMEKFSLDSRIYFGAGSAKEISAVLVAKGWRHVAWIIDQSLLDGNYVAEILASAKSAGLHWELVFAARSDREPDYGYLDEVAAQFRRLKFDALIGIGGGTACDVAKAVGVLMANEGHGIDYRGMDLVRNAGVPVILMPTTAGTGTEATQTASFNDLGEKRKLGINGCNVGAELSVLDPVLTVSCPRSVTLSAGLDAIVHAVEAVTARPANAFTKYLGATAFKMLYENFDRAMNEPDNLTGRMNMLVGSHFAGLAMANVGGGPASGISYPLGAWFGVPHGIAGGVFLGHVFELNVSKGYTGYAFLNDFIEPGLSAESEEWRAKRFVKNFWELYARIQGPEDLSGYGLTKSDLPHLTELTMTQREANLLANPMPCTKTDVEYLLGKVLA